MMLYKRTSSFFDDDGCRYLYWRLLTVLRRILTARHRWLSLNQALETPQPRTTLGGPGLDSGSLALRSTHIG